MTTRRRSWQDYAREAGAERAAAEVGTTPEELHKLAANFCSPPGIRRARQLRKVAVSLHPTGNRPPLPAPFEVEGTWVCVEAHASVEGRPYLRLVLKVDADIEIPFFVSARWLDDEILVTHPGTLVGLVTQLLRYLLAAGVTTHYAGLDLVADLNFGPPISGPPITTGALARDYPALAKVNWVTFLTPDAAAERIATALAGKPGRVLRTPIERKGPPFDHFYQDTPLPPKGA